MPQDSCAVVAMTPDFKRLCDAATVALEGNMGHTLPGTAQANQTAAEAIVRAVLTELREPSETMLAAGAYGSGEDSSRVARGAWEAMIDRILTDAP